VIDRGRPQVSDGAGDGGTVEQVHGTPGDPDIRGRRLAPAGFDHAVTAGSD
jgi:hypothetical protein